jgi:hypothetical protein
VRSELSFGVVLRRFGSDVRPVRNCYHDRKRMDLARAIGWACICCATVMAGMQFYPRIASASTADQAQVIKELGTVTTRRDPPCMSIP